MIRPISIEAVLGGFIVRVGCQTLVFQSRRGMMEMLDAYLQSPAEVEAKFVATAENSRFFPGLGLGGALGQAVPTETGRYRDAQVKSIGGGEAGYALNRDMPGLASTGRG